MSPTLAVSLPRFDGPLDLLLSLIRKNEFDIHDIPIATITKQYLDYVHQAEAMDMDLGSDFVYLAATLIQIKSRYLLPQDPEVAAREPDPREDLVRQLLSHEQVRTAAEFLHERFEVAGASWSKPKSKVFEEPAEQGSADPATLNLFDVLQLAKKALELAQTHKTLRLQEEQVTVEQMIDWLSKKLDQLPYPNPLPSDVLFGEHQDVSSGIALFLAMLEMSRRGDFSLEQQAEFGPIYLCRAGVV